ncbi:MAG TPA: 2-dehydro-3-deoxygalactonokinase, partial [Micavibrio sp.]
GAIGSREGWIDTGYVEAPSDLEKLARGLRVLEENEKRDLPNREISILPGLAVMHENGRHDVMRSEDVKSLGAAIHSGIKDSVLCIPGTHCKWVRIRGGAIIDFHSVLTGEFYAVLGEMGALASVLRADENNQTMDYDSFDRGLDLTRAGHDLLADLWQVRCQKLRAAAPPAHLRSYFSGILIGHELRQMEIVFPGLKEITLVSDSGTRKNLYGHALKKMGLSVLAEVESEAAICAGLSALKACL